MHTYTAECVSPKHPDKTCDRIADVLLDAYLAGDAASRVAIEVMGGHGLVTINGEVTSTARPDVVALVRGVVGEGFDMRVNLAVQSPEIARGVDTGGAGDQGIMVGYACAETGTLMPLEYELARTLCREIFMQYPHDGKTQVTVEDGKVRAVVASFQHAKNKELRALVERIIPGADEYLINPAGEWHVGGFDADTGLSGRKLVIDSYGPRVSVGGGSFSGKDYTKVDRSGAYMARKIAVDFVKRGAKEALVTLAYAIGKPEPVMAVARVDGKETDIFGYDLTPRGIRDALKLKDVTFADTAAWGHFGRGFPWDA